MQKRGGYLLNAKDLLAANRLPASKAAVSLPKTIFYVPVLAAARCSLKMDFADCSPGREISLEIFAISLASGTLVTTAPK